jgi:hypothetical protein
VEKAVAEHEKEEAQRWTTKRKAALGLSVVKGDTSVQEAARKHGLTVCWATLVASPSAAESSASLNSRACPRSTSSSVMRTYRQLFAGRSSSPRNPVFVFISMTSGLNCSTPRGRLLTSTVIVASIAQQRNPSRSTRFCHRKNPLRSQCNTLIRFRTRLPKAQDAPLEGSLPHFRHMATGGAHPYHPRAFPCDCPLRQKSGYGYQGRLRSAHPQRIAPPSYECIPRMPAFSLKCRLRPAHPGPPLAVPACMPERSCGSCGLSCAHASPLIFRSAHGARMIGGEEWRKQWQGHSWMLHAVRKFTWDTSLSSSQSKDCPVNGFDRRGEATIARRWDPCR